MQLRKMIWFGVAVVSMVCPRLGHAQTIDERISILEDKIKERAAALPFDFNALIATDYQYSFNTPSSHDVRLHTFVPNAPTFSINDAALFFGRNRDDEPFGFQLSFDFGQTGATVNGINESTPGLREAYLLYKSPINFPTSDKGITLKAGKFVTLLGYEVIKTPTNFNPNISNSIQFGYGVNFTNVGAMANVPVADFLSFDLGVINGWDDPTDNNSSLTFMGGMSLTPIDWFSSYIAGSYGAEQPNNNGSKIGCLTANATFKATDFLTFVIDGTWAAENDITFNTNGKTGTANWEGLAGYAIWQITQPLQVVLRLETFNDPEGVRTGASVNPNAPQGAGTVWALTPTIAYQLAEHLWARAEYRYDRASRRYFDFGDLNQDGTSPVRRTSNVMIMEGIFAF